MDVETHKLWEQSINSDRRPTTWPNLQEFLETRFRTLEAVGAKTKTSNMRSEAWKTPAKSAALLGVKENSKGCTICSKPHPLFRCNQFRRMDVISRRKHVIDKELCHKCFKPGHNTANCEAKNCHKCNEAHNTLLHTDPAITSNSTNLAATNASRQRKYVLLATIHMKVKGAHGDFIKCRAVLDSGSQLNFITEDLREQLGIRVTIPTIPSQE